MALTARSTIARASSDSARAAPGGVSTRPATSAGNNFRMAASAGREGTDKRRGFQRKGSRGGRQRCDGDEGIAASLGRALRALARGSRRNEDGRLRVIALAVGPPWAAEPAAVPERRGAAPRLEDERRGAASAPAAA